MKSNFRIAYDRELNDRQLEAVECLHGPLLVIAGAGSGKTRTLTYRVARLLEEGISPGSILLLTFTRKAAQEMLSRAAKLLDDRPMGVSGGTFHSFANTVLRRYAARIGFDSRFSIIDRADSESLILNIRKEMGPVRKNQAFPKKRTLANIFSRMINKDETLDDIVYDEYPHFIPALDTIGKIETLYRQRKKEHNFLDYDDLLVYLQALLTHHPDVLERLSGTYRYLMVDEYQDTNRIQADIVYRLAAHHGNVMVVGDDAQSIYAFRGANFENIFRFPEIFPDTRIIRLEENYRSIQPILSLTNLIIGQADRKFTKTLFTRREGGALPALVATGSENSQSRFIVEQIDRLQGEGIPLNQIAVLFRAGFHSFDLEIELGREGYPFIKVGGFKFMESAHIKDLLAHIKVLANGTDRISWYRILLLLDKIGPKTARSIFDLIRAQGKDYTGFLSIQPKTNNGAGIDRLRKLYAAIAEKEMSPVEVGDAVLGYYLPLLRAAYDDHPRRLKDLEQLLAIMERYDDLDGFLADMALEPPTTSSENRLQVDDPREERLVLSTIHSAKGLEWHTVFVIWTLDGRFPSIHALQNEGELEEELRLMYVAATRARENLLFTYPIQGYDRGADMFLTRPSRFLDGIPEDILEKWAVDLY